MPEAGDGRSKWPQKNKRGFVLGGGANETILLYLDCGGSYTSACIYQNSNNCIPKRVKFAVCKLYPNKNHNLDIKIIH